MEDGKFSLDARLPQKFASVAFFQRELRCSLTDITGEKGLPAYVDILGGGGH